MNSLATKMLTAVGCIVLAKDGARQLAHGTILPSLNLSTTLSLAVATMMSISTISLW
jgi:hypothetical protein